MKNRNKLDEVTQRSAPVSGLVALSLALSTVAFGAQAQDAWPVEAPAASEPETLATQPEAVEATDVLEQEGAPVAVEAAPAEVAEPFAESSAEAVEPELAQEAEPAAAAFGIEEIVVTARRRAESIQSVPVAVTALSGDALTRAGVGDVEGLATQVPSLVIVPGPSANRATPVYAIRGLSAQDQTAFSDPAIALYMNDVVVGRTNGSNGALYDLETVEVLKGPQGTLFGRNATGGAINIRSQRPGKDFDGYVGLGVGSFGRLDTEYMINVPLSDWAQLRYAGKGSRSDGWLKDTVLDENINTADSRGERLSLALQPIEGLESLFIYSRFKADDGGTGAQVTALNPTRFNSTFNNAVGYVGSWDPYLQIDNQRALGHRKTASGVEQYSTVDNWDLSNATTFQVNDWLSLKNIVGVRRTEAHSLDDLDGTPLPIMSININVDSEQLSNEFQILGDHDQTSWLVGLYYANEKARTENYSISLQPMRAHPHPAPTGFDAWSVTDSIADNTTRAVFAQATQKLDALVYGLSVTVGGRYTWDKREGTVNNRIKAGSPPAELCNYVLDDGNPNTLDPRPALGDCMLTREKDFGEFTYNASIDYKWSPRNLVYVAHRKGYRAGSWNARPASDAMFIITDPETVKDIEIGSKNDFTIAGRPLRLNVALFTADFTNIQRLVANTTTVDVGGEQVPTFGGAIATGEATIRGIETDFSFMPADWLELSGFHSYTDAEFDKFNDPISGADLSKSPFARAPKNIVSFTTRFLLPLPSHVGEASLQATYWHTDGYSATDNYNAMAMADQYELVNLRANWQRVFGTGFDLGLYVNNVLNDEYVIPLNTLYDSALGSASVTPGEPRAVGLDIRYRFGG